MTDGRTGEGIDRRLDDSQDVWHYSAVAHKRIASNVSTVVPHSGRTLLSGKFIIFWGQLAVFGCILTLFEKKLA